MAAEGKAWIPLFTVYGDVFSLLESAFHGQGRSLVYCFK